MDEKSDTSDQPPLTKNPRGGFPFWPWVLFALMAAAVTGAGWLGWQVQTVTQRKNALARITVERAAYAAYADPAEIPPQATLRLGSFVDPTAFIVLAVPKDNNGPSKTRRWLGDRFVAGIWLPKATSLGEANEIGALFPEAFVMQRRDE